MVENRLQAQIAVAKDSCSFPTFPTPIAPLNAVEVLIHSTNACYAGKNLKL